MQHMLGSADSSLCVVTAAVAATELTVKLVLHQRSWSFLTVTMRHSAAQPCCYCGFHLK